MMHKDVECRPEWPDRKDNNQLGSFGLCAPAFFLQKWDTRKQGEQRRQSSLGRSEEWFIILHFFGSWERDLHRKKKTIS